jgi:hypothetical protein
VNGRGSGQELLLEIRQRRWWRHAAMSRHRGLGRHAKKAWRAGSWPRHLLWRYVRADHIESNLVGPFVLKAWRRIEERVRKRERVGRERVGEGAGQGAGEGAGEGAGDHRRGSCGLLACSRGSCRRTTRRPEIVRARVCPRAAAQVARLAGSRAGRCCPRPSGWRT